MKEITKQYLNNFIPTYHKKGYPTPKWIQFCIAMIDLGWSVKLYRAKTTYSKYVYIIKRNKSLKIRFSNHRASFNKEMSSDSDYYVGVGNNGIITTEELIEIIKKLKT